MINSSYINNLLANFNLHTNKTISSTSTTKVKPVSNEFQTQDHILSGLEKLPLSFPLSVDDTTGFGKNLFHQAYPVGCEGPLNLNLPYNDSRGGRNPDNICELKDSKGRFSMRLTCLLDSNNPNFPFEKIVRKVGPNSQLVIARFTNDNDNIISKIPEHHQPIIFKSKVISRIHGSFKVDAFGNWYLYDHCSSSGTFLNNVRLSSSKNSSEDHLLKDMDIIQFGVTLNDPQGHIYRSVKLRIELNYNWKRKKVNILSNPSTSINPSLPFLQEEDDCSICLSQLMKNQPMFVSHCSHVWHFNCILPIVQATYPQFNCPNCRSYIDFQDFDDSSSEEEDGDGETNEELESTPQSRNIENNSASTY